MPINIGPKAKFPGMGFDPNQMMGPQMPKIMPDMPQMNGPSSLGPIDVGAGMKFPFMPPGNDTPQMPLPVENPSAMMRPMPMQNPSVPPNVMGGGGLRGNQPPPQSGGMMNRFQGLANNIGQQAGSWLMGNNRRRSGMNYSGR